MTLLTPRDWPDPLPEVAETGATFAENARLKAQALAEATGLPALADDSGLCVDALDGAPGLHSARWAGEGAIGCRPERTPAVRACRTFPPKQRTARFVCAVALAAAGRANGRRQKASAKGVILDAPRGGNGFGYDPLFLLPELGRTMAELTPTEKNASAIAPTVPIRLASCAPKFVHSIALLCLSARKRRVYRSNLA